MLRYTLPVELCLETTVQRYCHTSASGHMLRLFLGREAGLKEADQSATAPRGAVAAVAEQRAA